jgi:hypothetical protein
MLQLRLFEIGRDPDVVAVERNNGHQLLAYGYVLSWLGRPLAHETATGCDDRGVLKVQLGLLQLRSGALRLSFGGPRFGHLGGNLLRPGFGVSH